MANKTKICLSTVYRVGTLGLPNLNALKDYYCNIMRNKKYSRVFIIGDLNLPNISEIEWASGNCSNGFDQVFLDMFNDLSLEQCIKEPTHRHGNILDVLLTNSPQTLQNVQVRDEGSVCASDHFPVTFNVKANVRRKKAINRDIFNFKKANWDKLNEELGSHPWHSILNSSDIEICWNNFKSTLDKSCKKHIPIIKAKDGFKPPWFDSEVFSICREKERIRKSIKILKSKPNNQSTTDSTVAGTPNPKILELELKFQSARKQMRQLIRSKMYSNFSDKQSENAISKKFWSYVKASSNTHRIPETIHYNDIFKNDFKEQANLFNEFFFQQFSSKSEYDIEISYPKQSELQFNPVDVLKILRSTDPNKAPGPDQIHGKILKMCAKNVAVPLAMLFETSYYTCTIPNDWKSANVVPVFKKGSKSSVQNYRPISLTSLVMKIYERIIASEILSRVNGKIDNRQHGFLPLKSCESQLIPFADNLANCLNKGSRMDVVYFDFAKAFDSVNHDIILRKLKENFGINGFLLKFLVEYLSNRNQRVIIGNTFSDSLPVVSGVPQGSILGPLLFVLFINDIGAEVSPSSNILLYADDTKLYREIIEENDEQTLQTDITALNNWAIVNKMRFHPQKCKVLSVTLQRNHKDKYTYQLNGVPLQYVESEKDLGVNISANLCWTNHVNYLYSKANRNFGLLRRTCHFVKNLRQRRSLYLAMVRSQFEHCSSLWFSCSATMVEKLESLQKRCLKWILKEEFHSYSPELYYNRCRELDILPLQYRLTLKDLKLFHNIIHSRSSISLPEHMHFHHGNSRLRSSHLDELSIVSDISPRITLNYNKSQADIVSSSLSQFSRSYFYRTMNSWNLLPLETRKLSLPNQFESELLKHLWERARPITE